MQRRTDKPNPISAHEDAVDSSFLLTPITRHANRLTSRIGNCAPNMESNVTSWAVSFNGFICDWIVTFPRVDQRRRLLGHNRGFYRTVLKRTILKRVWIEAGGGAAVFVYFLLWEEVWWAFA